MTLALGTLCLALWPAWIWLVSRWAVRPLASEQIEAWRQCRIRAEWRPRRRGTRRQR